MCYDLNSLFNYNLSAWYSLASKVAFFDFFETDYAVFASVDSVVAAHISAVTSDFGSAGLADENFASTDSLTTCAFDTKSSSSVVVDIFA